MTLADRKCLNCETSLQGYTPRARFCGGPCRAEHWRNTHPEETKASVQRRSQKRRRGPGGRAPTHYAVFEKKGLAMAMVGYSVAHDRESAIREVSGDLDPAGSFVAIPVRSLRSYTADGDPVSG